ncbi:MAG: MraY family glycosyltransferase [Chloroflexota bacterium]
MINSGDLYPWFVFSNILVGVVLSLGLGWLSIRIARAIRLIDVPGILPHKKHGTATPLAGGLTLVLVLAVGGFVFNYTMVLELWPILVPTLIIFAMALWDDYKRLPPTVKFAGQISAAVILVALGTYVQVIPRGVLGLPGDIYIYLNYLITILWVVGVTNAFNFIDSMDGLVVGVQGIAIAFLILVSLGSDQVSLLRILTLLMGCSVGLYYYNMSPARFFMGDSGAQTTGFLLAALGILYTPQQFPQASSWFLPILILGVPIFDTCLVVFSRLRHGTPVYQAGRDHTYHRLVSLGLDTNRAVAIMHVAAILLGCIAFILLNLSPVPANIVFALVIIVGVMIYLFLDKQHEG